MVSQRDKSKKHGGHIEIKTNVVRSDVARKIVRKGTIDAVITRKTITSRAQDIFRKSDIAYAERVKVKETEREKERRR